MLSTKYDLWWFKTFNIAKNKKYDGYQHGLASMVFNFLDKKTWSGAIKKEIN